MVRVTAHKKETGEYEQRDFQTTGAARKFADRQLDKYLNDAEKVFVSIQRQ